MTDLLGLIEMLLLAKDEFHLGVEQVEDSVVGSEGDALQGVDHSVTPGIKKNLCEKLGIVN